jgi:ribosomal RNA methyltransferase Nop2
VLKNFKETRDSARSRRSYLDELNDLLCQYYGYNRELMELIMELFCGNELYEFLEANERPRPTTIRTNTLKTRRKELA